jgi:uncharacterized protein (TIGR02594 family)
MGAFMRGFLAAILCLFCFPVFAEEHGSANSVRICDKSTGCRYVEISQPSFGTLKPTPAVAKRQAKLEKRKGTTVVDGKTFKQTPGVVSHHSNATRWISEARLYLGSTGGQLRMVHRRWCGEFMGRVARSVGMKTPRNPNWAADWDEVGYRISGPQVGAVALIGKRRIHHVGIVTGIDAHGNPIIISGNHANRVVETAYPRGSIAAYIWPG